MSGQTKLLLPSGGSVTIAGQNSASNVVVTIPAVTATLLNDQSNIETQTKTALNATGSAPVYGCRAWVNFNGTGTVAIRASGNVSSITDTGVGNYTVNFTTAMPDANFACEVSAYSASSGATAIKVQPYRTVSASSQPIASTDAAGTAFIDLDQIHVAIFR